MTLLTTVIGRGTTGAKPLATAVPAGSLYYDTTLGMMQRSTGAAWENCDPAGAGVGDITFAAVQASQLVNEIKGWPACVNAGDLDALNLWWDKVGTPTTAPTVTDTSVAGLTDNYELCLKVVADAAGEGLYQRFTYADEPRVKAGRTVSALLAIWSVSAVSVTAKLLNSDASETAAAAVTAAAWTIVEIPAHVLAGTYVDLQVTAGAAGTFYVVPLGMNIGSRGFPLSPRGERFVDIKTAGIFSGDPGAAGYADLDLTASTSNLCKAVQLAAFYRNTTSINVDIRVRRNGDTGDTQAYEIVRSMTTGSTYAAARARVTTDDGQIIEWKSSGAVGDAESLVIDVDGFWEWE